MLLSPVPPGLSAAGWATAALGVWMAIWWATEAIPLFATALLPLLILPLLVAVGLWVWGMVDAYQGAQQWNRRHGILS